MTKAALNQMVYNLASEWGPEGIRVNGVAPWYTEKRNCTLLLPTVSLTVAFLLPFDLVLEQ